MAVAALLQRNGHLAHPFIDTWVDGADEYLAACAEWTVDRAADVCGLDPADIEQFAEMYGSIRPAMLRVGWGQERNRNGGSASRAGSRCRHWPDSSACRVQRLQLDQWRSGLRRGGGPTWWWAMRPCPSVDRSI